MSDNLHFLLSHTVNYPEIATQIPNAYIKIADVHLSLGKTDVHVDY